MGPLIVAAPLRRDRVYWLDWEGTTLWCLQISFEWRGDGGGTSEVRLFRSFLRRFPFFFFFVQTVGYM